MATASRRLAGKPKSGQTLALALGGGGARGLAHVVVLEALDEMGVRPALIAGTSIGAIVGAAYCSGVPARDIRLHVARSFRDRAGMIQKLLAARVGRWADLLSAGLGNPVMVDGEKLIGSFMPDGTKETFAELALPLRVVATDFAARAPHVFREGPLMPAVAASSAVPGLVRPVLVGGQVFVDGAATDPVPVDVAHGEADIVLAVDVTGRPILKSGHVPTALEATLAATQIMQSRITANVLRQMPPEVLVVPKVDHYGVLDFLQAHSIFRVCEPLKDEVKRKLEAAMAG